MKVMDDICRAGNISELNEDYLIFCDKSANNSFVLVLDGATGLSTARLPETLKYKTWAQWFVQRMGELVSEKIRKVNDLEQMLKECISILWDEYKGMLPADEIPEEKVRKILDPSASMALLRETKSGVDLIMLGDISVLLKFTDGYIQQVYDDSVELLDKEVVRLLVDISKERQISVRDAMNTKEVQDKLKENRSKKNSGSDDGYWILGLDEEIVKHAEVYHWKKGQDDIPVSMLICSDGFAAYYENYAYGCLKSKDKINSFYHEVEDVGLKEIYDRLRDIEKLDGSCTKFPRFKPSDDATAVFVKLRNRRLWWNVKYHRMIGWWQSVFMTLRVSKSVIFTIVTALSTIFYYCLMILFNDGEESQFNKIAFAGVIFTTVYTLVESIISYYKWKRGMRILTDSVYKKEIQSIWKLSAEEKKDGFRIKKFYNGKSDEYYIESEKFNEELQNGRQFQYKDMRCRYRLPESVKKLVPKLMENVFNKPGIAFNGRLLRQASHLGISDKTVLVQKVGYFDGQCSHEIVFKQFYSPEQIDVFFEGKSLLMSEKGLIYNLGHSPCANFLGASTLVITKDKYILLQKQGFFSMANRGRYAPSGSGSVDYKDIKRASKHYRRNEKNLKFNDILSFAMEREFCEECNYELKEMPYVMKTMLVGYVRLLERGGKPDYFGFSYLDRNIAKGQERDHYSGDIRKKEYGWTDRIEAIPFDTWDELPEALEREVKRYTEECKISIQLYLLMKYLKEMKKRGVLMERLKELGCELEE